MSDTSTTAASADTVTPIKVDVWSDIACPWCFIGKRKFEAGAAASGIPVEIEYHSFELSPDTPRDFVGSTVEYLASRKGLPEGQVHEMLDRVTGIASTVGLAYDFDAVQHVNTVKAHQVLHFAKARGLQLELKERLLAAYFEQGRNLADDATLAELAAEVGLDAAEVRASLAADEYLPAVHADQAQAQAYGIQGVPFFVIDGRYGVSGAQEAATFANVLTQVADERETGEQA